jgi:hypothetical protein
MYFIKGVSAIAPPTTKENNNLPTRVDLIASRSTSK